MKGKVISYSSDSWKTGVTEPNVGRRYSVDKLYFQPKECWELTLSL